MLTALAFTVNGTSPFDWVAERSHFSMRELRARAGRSVAPVVGTKCMLRTITP